MACLQDNLATLRCSLTFPCVEFHGHAMSSRGRFGILYEEVIKRRKKKLTVYVAPFFAEFCAV